MNALANVLLATVNAYGAPVLGLLLMLGALGFPFPTTLLVIASGALIREGVLSTESVVLIGLPGALLGDSLSYTLGRLAQERLLQRFGGTNAWQRAGQSFFQHGGLTIFLTRWLFTGIAIPTNLVAGGSGYSFSRFLVMALFGETTWMALFGSLGYWFGSQWQVASQVAEQMGGPILGAAIAGIGIYTGMKLVQRMRVQFA